MLMIDLFIIEHSEGRHTLNDVMKRLYDEYLTTGYTEDDFQQLCVEYGEQKVSEVFINHIYGIEDYTNSLKSALKVVGFDLVKVNNPNQPPIKFGFISIVDNSKHIIKKVQNNSPADTNGIAVDDEVMSINGIETKGKKMIDLLSNTTGTVSIKVRNDLALVKWIWNAVTSTYFIVWKS